MKSRTGGASGGAKRALRIVIEDRPFNPAEALDLGLVDEVVASSELRQVAIAEATRLGSRPKVAIGACKRAVYEGAALSVRAGLRREAAEFLSALGSADARSAMAAYVDATERGGDLPAYDPAQVAQALSRGRFEADVSR